MGGFSFLDGTGGRDGGGSGETFSFAAPPAGQFAAPSEEHTNCIK